MADLDAYVHAVENVAPASDNLSAYSYAVEVVTFNPVVDFTGWGVPT